MTRLKIRKISPTVGAEIEGVDLMGDVDAGTWRQMCQAFDECGVLVFRDVDVDGGSRAPDVFSDGGGNVFDHPALLLQRSAFDDFYRDQRHI